MISLPRLSADLRSGALSPVDHVRDTCERLAADTHSAVVLLDADRALADAAERAAELARGEWRGPLHGVAVGVKDLFDVARLPTRAGSDVLADAPAATADAAVVTRLRAAGAVVVAKLHTHEFAYGPTGDVSASGPARNPHDPTRITGGSSSGSAAAVAAGHLALAMGTDTGASVRTPAALCGVVGLKPAYGRLPVDGVFPLSETCDHVGLLTADVDGAALAWDALTGTGTPAVARRVGVLVDDYWRADDAGLTAAVDAAVARLRADGVTVVEIRTPMIEELAATYPVIVGAEAYATHARWFDDRPQDYQPATRERLGPQRDLPAHVYVAAQRTRRRLVAEFRAAVDGVDALVLPTTRLRATPIGQETVDGVAVRPALLALTLPFNLTGWPAVSVPGATEGLPAGVQVVGVTLDERGVLALARRLV
ncbi:amidase [Pseudonocardia hydrocarbonoxydans]|uniref:Amidohydrolase n=1 Tax=Pseudonocardia hydrocarbonoxydans TaxID=76726 RepID=A0A4Y3WXC6_9PSEU|nr:amidase [Pseudonocardia hydrocarbonoxydans]GEC22399.1 amidohydrolase [Pseudonocardia hydrocarbonoxydans]